MKRILSTAGWLVVAAALTIGMTACSGSEDIADSQQTPAGEAAPKTYTMTIEASKGGGAQARATRSGGTVMCATWADGSDEAMTEEACGGATRALSLGSDGKTLNASWTAGDEVKVLKVGSTNFETVYFDLGTLTAVNVSDETCTLVGTLDGVKIEAAHGLGEGNKLVLVAPAAKAGSGGDITLTYTGQDGTLAKIASDYDYSMTSLIGSKMITVASVDNGNITTGTATFAPQQAIVRFTLVDEEDNPLVTNGLTISAGGLQPSEHPTSGTAMGGTNSLTLTNGNGSNVFYAALRGVSNTPVTLSATGSDGIPYTYTTSSDVTFSNGKFYDIKVMMKYDQVDLSKLSGPYTVQSGKILSGSTSQTVTIASGATVTLKDATITGGIVCSGNANIILVGSNSVNGPNFKCGIQAAAEYFTLTISGSGSLSAMGGNNAAGIGSGNEGHCGDITISSTVTAWGGNGAAGIGSGFLGNCGVITISSGTVTARGGDGAAGIGSGSAGDCGAITIGSGITRVTAIKGSGADHPIGRGLSGSYGTVTVDGVEHWAGTGTEHLYFAVSTTDDTNDTWTLTHK